MFTSFTSNKWKLLSFGLMAVLATGFVAPQAFAAGTKDVLSIVTDIQTAISDPSIGLAAIQNNVNSKASQTSVNNLQTATNAIKSKTDNLPADPASNSAITAAQNAINNHVDSVVAGLAPSTGIPGSQCVAIDIDNSGIVVATSELSPRPHPQVNYSNCYLDKTSFSATDLTDSTFAHASVKNSFFSGTTLIRANLTGAYVQGDDMKAVSGEHAIFKNTNATQTYLGYSNLQYSSFQASDLTNAKFEFAKLQFANFDNANLQGTNFNSANLTGTTFAKCTGTPTGVQSAGTLPVC